MLRRARDTSSAFPRRGGVLRALLAVLVVAALMPPAGPADPQPAALPEVEVVSHVSPGVQRTTGTLTVISSDSGKCLAAYACLKFKISACPGVASDRIGHLALLTPSSPSPPKGLIVFFGGGPGTQYWSNNNTAATEFVEGSDGLIARGYEVVQVKWDEGGWLKASPGEGGPAHVACRPATVVKFLHDVGMTNVGPAPGKTQAYKPATMAPAAQGACGFCIVGTSGGSTAVAYPVSHFGMESMLDGVFPVSGPTHAAMTKGCLREKRFNQYWYAGSSEQEIDAPYGFTGTTGPCRQHDPLWAPKWDAESVDTSGSDYNHPATRVHLFLGETDTTVRAHASDYWLRLQDPNRLGGTTYVAQEFYAGGHSITASTDGMARLKNALTLSDVKHACVNGLDDDADGFSDYAGGAGDPGCTANNDASEKDFSQTAPGCDNGKDDDGDGRVDAGLPGSSPDPGCTSPSDTSELEAGRACDDGVDNDRLEEPNYPGLDGHVDFAGKDLNLDGDYTDSGEFPPDPGCSNPEDSNEHDKNLACDDTVEDPNDPDDLAGYRVDPTLHDPDCLTPAWPTELQNLSIEDASAAEPEGSVKFVVRLSTPSTGTVSVNFATASWPGINPASSDDYTATTQTVTFTGGAITRTVSVPIANDGVVEPKERFVANLSTANPSSIVLARSQAVGMIVDDDEAPPPPPPPSISVNDVTVTEGNSGITPAVFMLTLSAPAPSPVTVDYTTEAGTAQQSDGDYNGARGTATFQTGESSYPVTVNVNGDTREEPDEDFFLKLTNPHGATISDDTGRGLILNDDTGAGGGGVLSVGDVTVTEGNDGATPAVFTVTLSPAATGTVTVDYATQKGTAVPKEGDFKHARGTLTFDSGESTETVSIDVYGDTVVEEDEDFFLNLSNAQGATIGDPQGKGLIEDDDASPPPPPPPSEVTISVNNPAPVAEGAGGTETTAVFEVTLSQASTGTVTVDYQTKPGTARPRDGDFRNASGTLTFAPAETSKTVSVTVFGDDVDEEDENFFLNLSNPVGAAIADDQGEATILDDDNAFGGDGGGGDGGGEGPSLTVSDGGNVVERGPGETSYVRFVIRLSEASESTVTVDFATRDGAATVGSDYDERSGTATFEPGQTTKAVRVPVFGDDVPEPDEDFSCDLSSPSGATMSKASGTATIVNDD